MQSLIRLLLRSRVLRPLRVVAQFEKDPVGTQVRVLRGLLSKAAGTQWGRKYRFAELAELACPVQAYQERLLLRRYGDYRAEIARMRAGEPDVLWPGTVRSFATSAGTTMRGKYTPATDELIQGNLDNVAAGLLIRLDEAGDLSCLWGIPLSLTGFVLEDPEHPGVRVGEISGLGAEFWYGRKRLRRAIARRKNIPDQIRRMVSWDEKLDAIVEYTLDRDVRILAMVPIWGLQLVDRLIERYNERNSPRASTIHDIWPNLSVVISGGVPLRAYRQRLEHWIGPPAVDFVELYGASEASMAFQSSRNDPALELHLDNGTFFEFVRRGQEADPGATRVTVAEVELGVDYVPVVTTCGGLWAYVIDDVVRFTSLSPHKILVIGRTAELLDSYGESLRGEEAREAICSAASTTGLAVREFHVAPRPAGHGRPHSHQWLVEFEAGEQPDGEFAEVLDGRLQELNPAYACCRREKGFGVPEVLTLPKGSFLRWLDSTADKVSAQSKIPCLSDNRDLADGVLELCGKGKLARV